MAVLGSDNLTHSTTFKFNTAEPSFIIDEVGRIIRGPNAVIPVSTVLPGLQLAGISQANFAHLNITRFGNDNVGPALTLGKSRGDGSLTIGTAVQSNDSLGAIVWYADNGTDMAVGRASINCKAVGNHSGTNGGTDLIFGLTAQNNTNQGTRLILKDNGRILSGAGIFWSGTVSQSDESSVFQEGSNANGTFTKYADGTQICHGTAASNSSGDVRTITLPASFINTAYAVVACPIATTISRIVGTSGQTTTNFRHQTFVEDGARSAVQSRYIAIGRWY